MTTLSPEAEQLRDQAGGDLATAIAITRAQIADGRTETGPGTPKWITDMFDEADRKVDQVELAHLRRENAELRRERDDLIDQRIRADELWAENQELRATVQRYENRGRGGW